MRRTSNIELPSVDELFAILAQESQRMAARYDFLQNYHDEMYGVLNKLSGANWSSNYPQLTLEELKVQVDDTIAKLTQMIMSRKVSIADLEKLYDALAIGEDPALERADAIFVFGSPSDQRVLKAVELYSKGLSRKIIVTGKGPYYRETRIAEADRMKTVLIHQGVPESDIIVESQSITMPDNAKRTIDDMEARQWYPTKIIIISSAYTMRRAYMEWYKFADWDLTIVPVGAAIRDPDLSRESWYKSERGVSMLLNEYAKIVIEHKMDLIRRDGR